MAHPFPTPAQMPHAASSAFSPTVRPAARSPGCAVAALAAGLLVALALAAGFFALRGAFPTIATTAPDRRALPVSTLDRVTLASTPVAFAESHGGERWKSQVILALDDPAFDRAIFHWASEDADHVDAVGFYLRDGQRMPAGVLDRARAQFGAHLREDNHQLSAPGIALAIEERHVNVSAHDPGLPRHRERMAGLYRALRHIAFGGGRPLALGERRALVNIDHPLAAVGQIPLATPIERAALVMGERFEGAQRQDEFYVVGLDHPWMIAARIRWRDEPGGTLGGAVLLFPAGFDFAAHVSRFDACLEPVLGPRREETKSHAAGRREQVFAARAGTPELRLGGGGVQVLVTSASNDAGWRRLFETLDRCGR